MTTPGIAPRGKRRALVLAGGGARGAYEVGVLRYVLRALPERAGLRPRFDIITGTSVGAINGCYLASRAERPDYGIEGLERLWLDLAVRDYLKLHLREIAQVMGGVLGIGGEGLLSRSRSHSGGRLGGILNTSSLDALVRDHFDAERLARNIDSGRIGAVTVSATEIATGRTVTFIQSRDPLPRWSRDSRRHAERTALQPEHALASAAIPFLFPPVRVDGGYYCDGSLRQPTPLSPALRLGADRVLVIALRHDGPEPAPPERRDEHLRAYPNALFLLGKVLNSLLLDPVQYDLAVLERINRILALGELVYGPTFEAELNRVVSPLRGKPYKIVDDILIQPSDDIGDLAAAVALGLNGREWGSGPAARLFRRFAQADARGQGDLLSYLLFEGSFARRLMDMGYRDAEAQHDALVRFFSDAEVAIDASAEFRAATPAEELVIEPPPGRRTEWGSET